MGMNSVDLFSATNYKNGFIKYNRMKTKDRRNDEAYIEVKVHPFIKPLMKKYAGTKTVFNFCSRYNDYEGFNKTEIWWETITRDSSDEVLEKQILGGLR